LALTAVQRTCVIGVRQPSGAAPVPSEAKPLFRPEALRPRLAAFALPPRVDGLRPKLAHWAGLLGTDGGDAFKERELLPDFLSDLFLGVLGYTGPADGGPTYTLSREQHVEVDGKYADAVLGHFGPAQRQFVVAVEGKGPRDPLERPFAGRRMSAVDQGYRYAINLPCDWIVVTNLRQIRLYHKGHDQYTYERFDLAALASDDAWLKKFVFLLGAERVVPAAGHCHLVELLGDSERIGAALTREYYGTYATLRRRAFEQLRAANAGVAPGAVLTATQKLLDRVLFCAFSEDRGLLPPETIAAAYRHSDPYNPRPIWENFRGLFRAIDQGNPQLQIPQYNGGLFEADPLLERLAVPDAVCEAFAQLAAYDYRPARQAADDTEAESGKLIDVDILGHIFEQSITDLERLRNVLDGRAAEEPAEGKSRRKKEGAFYTPAFITRYLVGQALGRVLAERFAALRARHEEQAPAAARGVLADPNVYDAAALKKPQREALRRFWEEWQEELNNVRLVDPACGSGAFLIEAFDQLHAAYQLSNDRLEEIRGHRSLLDLDRQILQYNLYGVDVNDEAVEICRLSLWIKTAQYGKVLTSLDHTIRVGNSVVADPAVHPKALDWPAAFPEVFKAGGFDVVVGNPPYVRQEWIADIKPYLQKHYRAYDGVADLYVYFYEVGLRLLRPGGRLSFIVTNKWMKAGYGEPLRRLFAEQAWMESVVDFGHAKQIFEDADVFPCIVMARKPNDRPAPETTRVCAIPREQLRIDDLTQQIKAEGFEIYRGRLSREPWSLEPPAVSTLLEKILRVGTPLKDFTGSKLYRGILTGLNEAFLLDTATKNALIAANARSAEILKPYVRGQDITRWNPDRVGLWMIALKSSGDHTWPWSKAGDQAEDVFSTTYPAIHAHFSRYREGLIKRQDQGRLWWELRSCAYWDKFETPKIFYQDITWQAQFALDAVGTLCNNTVYFLSSSDLWLLAALNSPLAWWFAWRKAQHGKDEALRFFTEFMERFPIPRPSPEQRAAAEEAVRRLIDITTSNQAGRRDLLDWLRVEYDIAKPSQKLADPLGLDAEAFVTEVKKVRGKGKALTVGALKALREEHARSVEPVRGLAPEAVGLERRLSDLVNAAHRLTPEEVALMWRTAPPRMPVGPSS